MPAFLFFAGCSSSPPSLPVEVKVITETQDRYDALPETLPAVILLPAAASSAVPAAITAVVEDELRRQLAAGKKLKPIGMGKWLAVNFARRKAENPFAFLAALRQEQYALPVAALCMPELFRCEDYFVLHLAFYPLDGTSYPVSVLRYFRGEKEISLMLSACLEEAYNRFFLVRRGEGKKRVVVEAFKLEFRKLLELESGEFEFIEAPLVTQYGNALREGDDFFSLLFAYSLAATDLFQVMRLADFSSYAGGSGVGAGQADYVLRGRLQLADEINVLYVEVYSPGGARLAGFRLPFKNPTLKKIWDVCQEGAARVAQSVLPEEKLGRVPPLDVEGGEFFSQGMFTGWDSLPGLVLPRGMRVITAVSGEMQAVRKVFYILLDGEALVFTDREGEYLWNLLKK
ncbi:MAG: hypothetical protein LBC67_06180 [Spirochaetales bacterium]|nr:hypothetical protein [Spirochaetales bacterium]